MVDEDLQDLLLEFRKISGDIESHYQEREKLLKTLKVRLGLAEQENRCKIFPLPGMTRPPLLPLA